MSCQIVKCSCAILRWGGGEVKGVAAEVVCSRGCVWMPGKAWVAVVAIVRADQRQHGAEAANEELGGRGWP